MVLSIVDNFIAQQDAVHLGMRVIFGWIKRHQALSFGFTLLRERWHVTLPAFELLWKVELPRIA
jgi:hypothetical protein